ncbi:MAG TPA: SEC-C domain-containing protein [Bacteroidota bacterium]|nr:SEC-C domain-containing protein [Bacteroidota bacterium]
MGGSLDIIGSYIIGGIVLVLMAAVLLNLNDTTNQSVMNEMTQVTMAEMSQTMEKELSNIGYRVPDAQKVLSIDYRSIRFLSDYDNNGVVDTITYRMDRTRSGPRLTRTLSVPGQAARSWTSRGSIALFTAYDANGNPTTTPSAVRAIEASVLTSNVLYDRLGNYASTSSSSSQQSVTVNQTALLEEAVDCESGAYWHKTLYPKNLATVAPIIAESGTPGSGGGTGGSTGGSSGGTTGGGTGGTTDPGTGGSTGGDTGGGTDPGSGGVTDPGSGTGTVTPPSGGTTTPGPNDPCWCGSGKKYKQCHGK